MRANHNNSAAATNKINNGKSLITSTVLRFNLIPKRNPCPVIIKSSTTVVHKSTSLVNFGAIKNNNYTNSLSSSCNNICRNKDSSISHDTQIKSNYRFPSLNKSLKSHANDTITTNSFTHKRFSPNNPIIDEEALRHTASARSPEEAIRVTNRGLVRERIKQFNSIPSSSSTDNIHTIPTDTFLLSDLSPHRMATVCESDILRKREKARSACIRKRPASQYSIGTSQMNTSSSTNSIDNIFADISNTAITEQRGMLNRRNSTSSPERFRALSRGIAKSTSFQDGFLTNQDLSSFKPKTNLLRETNSSRTRNNYTSEPSRYTRLSNSVSFPSINIKTPSSPDFKKRYSLLKLNPSLNIGIDKNASISLSPETPDLCTNGNFQCKITSPTMRKRTPRHEYTSISVDIPKSCIDTKNKYLYTALPVRSPDEFFQEISPQRKLILRNNTEDSLSDEVFRFPEQQPTPQPSTTPILDDCNTKSTAPTSSGSASSDDSSQTPTLTPTTIRVKTRSSSTINTSTTDSETQDSKEKTFKSPTRKPSLLRKNGMNNSERKKRTVTFTPEVLLIQLCYEGRLKDVEQMLAESDFETEYINTLGPMGVTAMHQCALEGNLDCLQALVKAGGKVNVLDAEHCTPLHSAAINNHFSVIRFLLMAGADPTCVDDDNKTAYAISTDDRVKQVLEMACKGAKGVDTNSDTKGNLVFINHEDSEQTDDEGDHSSSELERSPAAEFRTSQPLLSCLSAEGLNTAAYNKKNNFQNETVATRNREFMGIKLIAKKNKQQPFNTFSSEDESQSLTSSYSGYSGELSGLNSSCGTSEDSPCKSPEAFSTQAYASTTHSSFGTDNDRDSLVNYDIDSDLEPESQDFKFQESVANLDSNSVSKILKDSKSLININRITKLGITALHHSVLEENYLLTKLLVIDGKADVNIRDRDGWTPLHAASAVGNLKIAKFLVENGARTSHWNASGEFAVDVAEDDAMKSYLHSIMLGTSAGNKSYPPMLT